MMCYGCQTLDLSCEQNMKRIQVCWNIAVRKIRSVPYTTHRYLLPHLMQSVDIYSELVCKYVKFYDIMLKCENENVRHLMKYSKYNAHGPPEKTRVHIYHTVGVDIDVATQRRNIRRYTIEKAISDVKDCIDGQREIELCNKRTENTPAEFNLDDINEMIYLLCTR